MENNQEIAKPILLKDLGMLYPNENSNHKKRYGLYKCCCGNEFKAGTENIKVGHTKSCGCYSKELISKLNKTHDFANHRLYYVWDAMINRCHNPNNKAYKDYGARGIFVCKEWHSVENFINDMYPSYVEGLTLDRKDNNLGYSKDNCRWATKAVQVRNTRRIGVTNTSGYRGVSFKKSKNIFMAYITINNKLIHIGYFKTAIEAAKARDKYIDDNNLEHTKNFE